MASSQTQLQQKLRLTANGSSNQDHEIAALRAELDKIRLELKTAKAEREYFLHSGSIKTDRASLERRRSPAPNVDDTVEQLSWPTAKGTAESSVPSPDPRIGRPKRILIIGGGPSGLITLHELLNPSNRRAGETLEGYHIELYERRPEVGGVWYFEPDNDLAKGWHYGKEGRNNSEHSNGSNSSTPERRNDTYSYAGDMEMLNWTALLQPSKKKPVPSPPNGTLDSKSDDFCYLTEPHGAPRWPSPAYEGLVGNVLPPLVEFAQKPMPEPAEGLFPSMTETHNWLLDLASPMRSFIKTNREVKSATPVWRNGAEHPPSWVVTSRNWSATPAGNEETQDWDAVIICCGAFEHPFYPEIRGLAPLLKSGSPCIMHAKSYPGPRPFVNQRNKIVVVGNANSANDIAAHLAPLNSAGPLYRCIRHESTFAHLPDPRIKDVPPIYEIRESDDGATLNLILDDGTKLNGITKVIFASGYQYKFDWIRVPKLPSDAHAKEGTFAPASAELTSASLHGAVPYLHAATFVSTIPTLSFIGLAACSTPLPLSEIQARIVARTLYNVMPFPAGAPFSLLEDYHERAAELELDPADPARWRMIHMIRGKWERVLVKLLLARLEENEKGCSAGLYRWDERREAIAKNLRAVKEGELRRLRNAHVSAGGVEGGVGGVLSTGVAIGVNGVVKPAPIRDPTFGRGKSVGL